MSNTVVKAVVRKGFSPNGTVEALAMSKNLGIRVAENQAFFQAAVERGRCFSVANQTGVTSQAGLSATTPVLTLANPSNSGVNAVLIYAAANFLVAFGAAAAIFAAVGTNTAAAAVTGTDTTAHRNLLLGGAAPIIIPKLAATLPAAPVAIDILGAGLTGAITTLPGQLPYERWYNGAIILPPGTNFSLQTSTASGASGMLCTYIWEEVPITND